MVALKKILLKMKEEYFALERKEEEQCQKKSVENSYCKTFENTKTMFKIRQDKKSQQKKVKIKPIEFNKLTLDTSFAEKKIGDQL